MGRLAFWVSAIFKCRLNQHRVYHNCCYIIISTSCMYMHMQNWVEQVHACEKQCGVVILSISICVRERACACVCVCSDKTFFKILLIPISLLIPQVRFTMIIGHYVYSLWSCWASTNDSPYHISSFFIKLAWYQNHWAKDAQMAVGNLMLQIVYLFLLVYYIRQCIIRYMYNHITTYYQ